MFGKVVVKTNFLDPSDIKVGVLFKIVDSLETSYNGLICVKTCDNIICLVGNDKFKSFETIWKLGYTFFYCDVLTKEQVILSNKEF